MEQIMLGIEPANTVLLRGILLDPPEFSHENHGRQFDRMILSVQRLSGAFDHLNVIAEHEMIERLDPGCGPMLEVEGEVRSYNNHSGQGRKLLISVFCNRMQYVAGNHENQVTVTGQMCREPVFRRTPLGREICDVMLAVDRRYHRRDYLPCILWGSVARMAADCPKGTGLTVHGRLQSRIYTKQTESGPEERTAYEISAITAEITSCAAP